MLGAEDYYFVLAVASAGRIKVGFYTIFDKALTW